MSFNCAYCEKQFSRKAYMIKHLNICKKVEVSRLTTQIENVQEQYEKKLEEQREQYEKKLEEQREQYEKKLEERQFHIDKIENQIQNQNDQHEQQLQTKDKEIQILKYELVEFKTQLFEIAKQPKQVTNHNNQNTQTTNNRILNITNNLVPMDLTDEQIREIVKNNYTRNVFLGGPDSIVEMTTSQLLTDQETGKFRIVCTDTSRNVFYYQDCDENLIKDIGMKDIHKKIQKPLVEATSSHYKKIDEENSMNDDKLSELFVENMSFIDNELPNRLKRNFQLPINNQE